MNPDDVIRDVVKDGVKKEGQPSDVAKHILTWYEQVLSRNESLLEGKVANKNAAFAHLDRIHSTMTSPFDREPEE